MNIDQLYFHWLLSTKENTQWAKIELGPFSLIMGGTLIDYNNRPQIMVNREHFRSTLIIHVCPSNFTTAQLLWVYPKVRRGSRATKTMVLQDQRADYRKNFPIVSKAKWGGVLSFRTPCSAGKISISRQTKGNNNP